MNEPKIMTTRMHPPVDIDRDENEKPVSEIEFICMIRKFYT